MRQSALKALFLFLLGLCICLLPLRALSYVSFSPDTTSVQPTESFQGTYIAQGRLGKVLPQAAIVNATKGKGLTIVEGIKDLGGARVDDKVAYNRRLDVPGGKGNGATLGFVSQLKQRIGGYLAAAGFSKASSEYFYPCGAKGSFAIGWESGTRDGCPKIQYRATTKIGPGRKSLTTEDSSNVQQKAQDNTVARVHLQQYCSVASNDHDEWSVNLTKEAWEQGKTEEVCEKALKECQEKSGGSCSIVSRDNWYSLAPSAPKVSLLLECADGKRYFRQGTGPDVHKLREDIEKEARGQNAAACAFNIFSHDEVLISPASDERTLIHTDSTDQGFVINDLVGTVEITPPGDPKNIQPITLKSGQRYEYRNTAAAVRTLERSEREAVTNLPVVQEFLRLNNWINEIDPEIEKYQLAINDQFLSKSCYFTVVFSSTDRAIAQQRANEINQTHPDLKAVVYTPYKDSKFYGVMIAQCASRQYAEQQCNLAKVRGIASDAYIWTYEKDYIPCTSSPGSIEPIISDLVSIRSKEEELAAEIATLRGRIDSLENRIAARPNSAGEKISIGQEVYDIKQRLSNLSNRIAENQTSLERLLVRNAPSPDSFRQSSNPSIKDIEVLLRLNEEFAAELASLNGRHQSIQAHYSTL